MGVQLYERPDRPRPSGALLWVHGGGFVAGDPARDHDLCSQFAAEARVLVVSVAYRLAPEHPFPAALDDCHTALIWLHEHADGLGVDARRIAVGGSSAGGGLPTPSEEGSGGRRGPTGSAGRAISVRNPGRAASPTTPQHHAGET